MSDYSEVKDNLTGILMSATQGVCPTDVDDISDALSLIEQQAAEIDTLKAHVERLRGAIDYCASYLAENRLNTIGSWSKAYKELQHALESTPQQSLNAVKRASFIDGYTAGNGYPPSDWEVNQYLESVKE